MIGKNAVSSERVSSHTLTIVWMVDLFIYGRQKVQNHLNPYLKVGEG